jgi:hypothetical protein
MKTAFVGRRGTLFTLGGRPFHPIGVNFYGAASDPRIYTCGVAPTNPDTDLDAWFARIHHDTGATVVRFWAFQSFTNGGSDFSALDRVLRLAAHNGMKVLPVLEDQYGACSRGGPRTADWYAAGYRYPYGGYPLSYREYVMRVVSRYHDNPTIFAWMLINEASSARGEVGDPEALLAFTTDMSALVKSLDQHHLVTLGSGGGVWLGVWGSLTRLHALSTIDFIDYHDYGENDAPLPGAPAAPAALAQTSIYTQDARYIWVETPRRTNGANTWETFSATIPPGETPFHFIGLNIRVNSGFPPPDIYIDDIRIGGRTIDFEDGATDGVTATGATVVGISTTTVYSGRYALHVVPQEPETFQVQVPAAPGDAPGAAISFHVYVHGQGAIENGALLADVLQVGATLHKPVLVSEAGMTVCSAENGAQLETPLSRAQKIDAKIAAFFKAGGAGYLVWDWTPASDCGNDFTSGDPLNAVLHRWATRSGP